MRHKIKKKHTVLLTFQQIHHYHLAHQFILLRNIPTSLVGVQIRAIIILKTIIIITKSMNTIVLKNVWPVLIK